MMLPTIHSNGTHPDALISDISDVKYQLYEAIKTLNKIAPHERDYYLNPNKNAFKQAVEEHKERIIKIADLINELEQLQEGIYSQLDNF